jgi:hypothetical protein
MEVSRLVDSIAGKMGFVNEQNVTNHMWLVTISLVELNRLNISWVEDDECPGCVTDTILC